MTTEMPPTEPEPAGEPMSGAPAPVDVGPPPAIPAVEPPPAPLQPAEAPAPAPEEVPVATATRPVAAAAPVSAPASTHRRRDRALGTTGQVFGIVGIVVCLLLVVGVVYGRGWAVGTVDNVAATVDAQIAKTGPLLDNAQSTVGEVSGRVSTVADIAAGIAANPSPGGDAAQTLRTALAGLSERYQGLRQGYADVRETVVSLIDRLKTLDRLVPGFSIPQGPIDALAAFDVRVKEFDAKLNDLLTIDPGEGPVNRAAGRISEAATGIDTKLQGVQDGIGDVKVKIAELRVKLSDTAGTIDTAITLVSIVLILLLLYLALLHWVLFRHSGEIRRKATTG